MDFAIGFLTFGTLTSVALFGLASARAVERRRRTATVKSTLAADAPSTRR